MRQLCVAIETKEFASRPILKDVRFDVSPGEVLAILAPSGTGKTTALRIVLGLDADFTGDVKRPLGCTGAVFQDPRLLPWMDVAGNLRLAVPALSDADIAVLLEDVGLAAVAAYYPKQLSLGMARRVALARALAVRPSLLVLDEPFASLDPSLAASLSLNVVSQARALGSITLFATHDLDQALAITDRILVLAGTSPATLAADLPVVSTDAAALRRQFPFLTGAERTVVHG